MSYRIFLYIVSLFVFLLTPRLSWAGEIDEHGPIGVMRDHSHKQGEWMVAYRYMHMDMPNNISGTNDLAVSDVHNNFMISPIDMTMDMHMLGVMYGVTDGVTAMIMIPYVIKEMDHRRRTDSKEFTTKTQGIGDVKVSALIALEGMMAQPVHFNFGIGFPSGSINETDDTLVRANDDLPYPMQLGSGTFSVLPGITYFDQHDSWSWGFQEATTVQLGKNDRKYKLGDSHELTGWLAYTWEEWISTSLRVKGSIWGNINGSDQRLNPNMVPTANPNLRGGERVDLFLGMNLLGTQGVLQDHRLALEVGYPVYQSLDGPQLGAGLQATLGWQKAW